MAFKPVKKIYKAGKTFLKNRYHDVFMVIWLWTLVNFGSTNKPLNTSTTHVSIISRSIDNFDLADDANRIIYNLVKNQIRNIDDPHEDISKVELCCNNNSSVNMNTTNLGFKNVTNNNNNNKPVVKSKSNNHFANAFSIKDSVFFRRPSKLFNDMLRPNSAFDNSNKTELKTYLNLTHDYNQTCAASSSSGNSGGSGSGNNGSVSDSENSSTVKTTDKIITREYFKKDTKKRSKITRNKKKKKNKREQYNQFTIHYDELVNKKNRGLKQIKSKNQKSAAIAKPPSRPRPGHKQIFKNSKSLKNKSEQLKFINRIDSTIIESHKLDQFGAELQPEYQERIKLIQHQDPIQPVSVEKFKRLAYNVEHQTPKVTSKAEPYTVKTVEECMGMLTAETRGYVQGEIYRPSLKQLIENQGMVDYISILRNSKTNQIEYKQFHELKTAFPDSANETFQEMGVRMTKKSIDQSERALNFDPSFDQANIYIDHRNLTAEQSMQVAQGPRSVKIHNPKIRVFQLNHER